MTTLDLLRALTWPDLVMLLWFFVLMDVPRYLLAAVAAPLFPVAGIAMNARITAIVPCYNEERALVYCIRSLRDSGVTRIIVVNDGSSDNTHAVAISLGVEVIDMPRRSGKPDAVNRALVEVKDEFVLAVDADTTFAEGAINRALACFEEGVGGVGFRMAPANEAETLTTRIQAIEYAVSYGPSRQLADLFGIMSNVSGAAGIFRKRALDEVGGWDCEVAEDAALAMKLRANGWRLRYAVDAEARTVVPASPVPLLFQRLRWDASVITIWWRKFGWMLNPLSPRFRISNALTVLDVLVFSAVMPVILPFYLLRLLSLAGPEVLDVLLALCAAMAAAELFVVLVAGISWRQLAYWPWYIVVALMVLRPLRAIAVLAELVFSITRYDPYIPAWQRKRLS